MTAVLRLNPQNEFPILVGDLLVSGPRTVRGPASLPTFETTANLFPKDAILVPHFLQQKVCVIGENLAVAWAGPYLEAKELITQLYHADRNGCLTFDFVEGCLGNVNDNSPGFVGFLRDGPGYTSFGYRFQRLDTHDLGQLGFLGTGADFLQSALKQALSIVDTVSPVSNAEGQEIGIANKSIALSLAITNNLLTHEVLSGATLQKLFGGGYEIAYLGPNGFRKLDDVTFALWTAKVRSPTTVSISPCPYHICMQCYAGDILAIRSMTLDPSHERDGNAHWGTIVCPIFRTVTDAETEAVQLPQLNTKWICNNFFVTGLDGTMAVLIRLNCRNSTIEQCMSLEVQYHAIAVGVEGAFLESVAQEILANDVMCQPSDKKNGNS